MKVGDFVECEGVDGRIVAVEEDYCLVYTVSGIFKLKKEILKVTVTLEDHQRAIQKAMEKEDWHERMHAEVVTYFDMTKPLEPQVEEHAQKLLKWLKENPPPKEE